MAAGPSPRAERLAFLTASGLVFLFVILRAARVPIVHDEAMTFFMYVDTGRFLPFRAHWDAANHLLCTALGWAAVKAFGVHLFALRLPSVLAFVLYAAYVRLWGLRLRGPVVRWCFWAAMLGMPFLLDFFSLFRGYGLGMALWLMALYGLCALLERPSVRRLVLVLAAAAAATYSALSLLTLWGLVLAIAAVPFLRGRRWAFLPPWLLLGVLPFMFAAFYMQRLSALGSLYYGLETGIVGGTVPSLLKVLLGRSHPALVALVVVAYAAGVVSALLAARRRERTFQAWAVMVAAGLLLADALGRMVLHAWNGTPYPEDRTALQWVPLFMVLLSFALDRASLRSANAKWAALALLILPVRTAVHANVRTTSYWPEQAIPDEIFRAAAEQQRGSPRLLTIGAYHQMQACWGFGLRQRGLRLNAVDWTAYPNGGQDLLLTDPARMQPPPGYRVLATAAGGHVALSKRESPAPMELVLDSVVVKPHGDDEFLELWHPAPADVRGHAFRVELMLRLHADRPPLTGNIVVEVNAHGESVHRDDALVQCMRNTASPDSLTTVRAIPQVPMDAERVVVYLWGWNPHHQGSAGSGRLRVYRMTGN